jgi:hypothetical protein
MNETLLTPSEAEAMEDHGKQQAQAQYESIAAMVAALRCDFERLEELREEREALAEAVEAAEVGHAEAVRVRAGDVDAYHALDEARAALADWDEENAEELNTLEHEAGEYSDADEVRERIQEDPLSIEVRSSWVSLGDVLSADEFRILLCTGGPAVQIVGELDRREPVRAWIEYQDWGTPWTQYFNADNDTLLAYCREFYFGG